MAIFGIGANYDDNDVSKEFIKNRAACVGWTSTEASALHEMLRYIKMGDIVYIKSAPIGQGLRVKAVGIVEDNTLRTIPNLGTGIIVNWLWSGHENLGKISDKYNVRNNTLYEEFNKGVQTEVLKLLLKNFTTI